MQLPRVAAFDMGGTSADVCLVEREPTRSSEGTIAGLPLPLPTMPVHTVAAGGGSIAYADAGGALRVGPQSAGADPGPACYGVGDQPTVTDAHVALGHLGADTLLDGGFPVDVDAAVRAIERLGKKLGMKPRATAEGVLRVADATMARAILVITAERAVDPATVPLVAYGGAGGLHAATLMAHLGMQRAVLPAHPGAFSALGLALAGEAVELGEAAHVPLTGDGLTDILRRGRELLARAREQLGKRGRGRAEALVRFRGQGASLSVPLTRRIAQDFEREHRRRFGFATDAPLEVVQLRVRCEAPARALPALELRGGDRPSTARRPPLGGPSVPVYDRRRLSRGVCGPAIVEEPTATTLVPAGCRLEPTPYGLVVAATRGKTRRSGR
jgi:N-methylhydantoinase A